MCLALLCAFSISITINAAAAHALLSSKMHHMSVIRILVNHQFGSMPLLNVVHPPAIYQQLTEQFRRLLLDVAALDFPVSRKWEQLFNLGVHGNAAVAHLLIEYLSELEAWAGILDRDLPRAVSSTHLALSSVAAAGVGVAVPNQAAFAAVAGLVGAFSGLERTLLEKLSDPAIWAARAKFSNQLISDRAPNLVSLGVRLMSNPPRNRMYDLTDQAYQFRREQLRIHPGYESEDEFYGIKQ
jgi:hypothetical protein